MRRKLGVVALVLTLVLSLVLTAAAIASDGTVAPDSKTDVLNQFRWLLRCILSVVRNPGDPAGALYLVYACSNALRTLEQ
jgi:hypothetical protein